MLDLTRFLLQMQAPTSNFRGSLNNHWNLRNHRKFEVEFYEYFAGNIFSDQWTTGLHFKF